MKKSKSIQAITRKASNGAALRKKAERLLTLLRSLYPEPKSELVFSGEYQLIVSVLLSAQCTDKKVNQVTPLLFARYPDFCSLSSALAADVEEIVRPINYYRTKAKNLIGLAQQVCHTFAGRMPRTHEELVSLPGVGNKTANVVLGEVGAAHTLPVDTHVFRLARRLGLATGEDVEKVEEELKRLFPSQEWRELHHSLIFHGRRVCKAQRPMCEGCSLREWCSWYEENGE